MTDDNDVVAEGHAPDRIAWVWLSDWARRNDVGVLVHGPCGRRA